MPSEPAREALYAFMGAKRTGTRLAASVYWGKLLGMRALGVLGATDGVLFYLTARGHGLRPWVFTK